MIDFTKVLKNMDGSTMMHGTTGQVFTLSLCAVNALVSGIAEPSLSGEDHLERFLLAEKIMDNKHAELTSEEITLIKERIAKSYTAPLVSGQAIKLLDPAQAKKQLAA